jgi:hypothetical protein
MRDVLANRARAALPTFPRKKKARFCTLKLRGSRRSRHPQPKYPKAERERTMMHFTFKAPTLLEPEAIPDANEYMHDEPKETSERLAKIKKFAHWLKAEMDRNGLSTQGPLLDPSGWVFEVPCDEGFVMCFVSNLDGDEACIDLLVTEIGGAAEGVDRAVEALLRSSSEIAELKVEL